ncbi:MAG: hypothetical protein H0W88_09805 [Parachlamydiaceae bacterium]|nr:hypothetical protein [Parachlamydiaceae bacterium]
MRIDPNFNLPFYNDSALKKEIPSSSLYDLDLEIREEVDKFSDLPFSPSQAGCSATCQGCTQSCRC